MSTTCGKCKKKVLNTDLGVGCDLCLDWYHSSCVGNPKEMHKAMSNVSGSFWFCDDHQEKIKIMLKNGGSNNEEYTKNLGNVREELTKISSLILETRQQPLSYAEIIKKSPSAVFPHSREAPCGIIVSSTTNLTSSEIEKQIKQKVDLKKIRTGVCQMKGISNQRVFLGTSDELSS